MKLLAGMLIGKSWFHEFDRRGRSMLRPHDFMDTPFYRQSAFLTSAPTYVILSKLTFLFCSERTQLLMSFRASCAAGREESLLRVGRLMWTTELHNPL
jgi:hypothetical protein